MKDIKYKWLGNKNLHIISTQNKKEQNRKKTV